MATNPATPFNAQPTERPENGLVHGESRTEEIVVKLADRLAVTANARNVYGDPVTAHNRTVIPVAKVGYGVGAGSGARPGKEPGSGGGGGGGVGARPLGYIEITSEGTRYVPFVSRTRVLATILAGFAGGVLLFRMLK